MSSCRLLGSREFTTSNKTATPLDVLLVVAQDAQPQPSSPDRLLILVHEHITHSITAVKSKPMVPLEGGTLCHQKE